ncbi:unnamed protein product, partial [Mesorhabditis spiculigera]
MFTIGKLCVPFAEKIIVYCRTRCGEMKFKYEAGNFLLSHNRYAIHTHSLPWNKRGQFDGSIDIQQNLVGDALELTIQNCDNEKALTILNKLFGGMTPNAVGLFICPLASKIKLRFPLRKLSLLQHPYSILLKSCPRVAMVQLDWLRRNAFPLDVVALIPTITCHLDRHLWKTEQQTLWYQLEDFSFLLVQILGIGRYLLDVLWTAENLTRWAGKHPPLPNGRERTMIIMYNHLLGRKRGRTLLKRDVEELRCFLQRHLPDPLPGIECLSRLMSD